MPSKNPFKIGDVWYIRYDLPRGADGKRKQKKKACPGMNEKRAKQALRDMLTAIHKNEYTIDDNQTVGDYMLSWLGQWKSQVAVTTLETYGYAVHKQIIPCLGNILLNNLKPISIQQMYDKLLDQGLSPKTIKNVHGVLHKALEQAVKMQFITKNSAAAVSPPRYIRKEANTLHKPNLGEFIEAVDKSSFRVPILIALATGMRRGEVLGLRWDDVDFDRNIIIVRRSIAQITGQVLEKETKNGKPRGIRFPKCLNPVLVKHMQIQMGKGIYSPEGWICAREDGRVQTPKTFGCVFYKLKTKYNFDFTLHGLRHTQASMLADAHIPTKVISERLGHADTNITDNLYIHPYPHSQSEAAEIINTLLSPYLDDPILGDPTGF